MKIIDYLSYNYEGFHYTEINNQWRLLFDTELNNKI